MVKKQFVNTKYANAVLLIAILLIAIFLRLYKFFDIPFTHDEFSALFRTNFNSFSSLIKFGVIPDGHPAGIQVFLYYYIKLFGSSPWVVKLPFVIMGLLSVYLIYYVSKIWFNITVGLINSAMFATLQFTVVYSQIARPYISGLFFCLLLVLFFTRLVKTPQTKFYINAAGFIVSAALCSYNHHFSLLMAAIIGLSGLFFIDKKYLVKYILAGIIVMILYLPHLPILLLQLKQGGVTWLFTPRYRFIAQYLGYCFNYSSLVYFVVLIVFVYGIVKAKSYNYNLKTFLLFAVWCSLPYLIAFYYSRHAVTVLQFSVLIFSFPFLLFVLFGHIPQLKVGINAIIVVLILSANIYSLVVTRHHYSIFYQSVYKQILIDNKAARQQNKNVLSIIDSHVPITNYYIDKYNFDTNFVCYTQKFKSHTCLLNYLENNYSNYDYLYFGALSGNNEISVPIIQRYYPKIEWQKNYFGGTTYLFSKEQQTVVNPINHNSFENVDNNWHQVNQLNIIDTIIYQGKHSYFIDSLTEWGPTFVHLLKPLYKNQNNFIDISVKVLNNKKLNNVLLCAQIMNGQNSHYFGALPVGSFKHITNNSKWVTAQYSVKLSDIDLNYKNLELKVYIWNRDKTNIIIDNFEINLRQGNELVYSLTEKF